MNFVIVALIIAFLWGVQPLIQKTLLNELSTHSVLLISNIIFTLCLLAYSIVYKKIIIQDVQKINSKHWRLLLFSAIICSFFTSIIYYDLIKNYNSSIVMALTYSAPVFTVFFGQFLLKESLSANAKIGICITVAGLGILSYSQ